MKYTIGYIQEMIETFIDYYLMLVTLNLLKP